MFGDLSTGELIAPSEKLVIDFDDEKHRYKVNGEEVPSVTQILDATLPKPALTWWGFRIGLAAAVELARSGDLPYGELVGGHDEHQRIVDGAPTEAMAHVRGKGSSAKPKTLIEYLALENRLDPNAIKRLAADRGTGIHEALNVLGLGGTPDIDAMPESARPFCQALYAWWLDREPDVQLMEQPVASLRLGYAGRFDLLYRDEGGSLVLADLKTSKENRPDSFFRQLMGYKVAWEEMGGAPIDRLEIVLCKPTGEYGVYDATTKVTPEIWEAAVAAFKADRAFRDLQRKRKS